MSTLGELSSSLYRRDQFGRFQTTDRVMGVLLILQWVFTMLLELVTHPLSSYGVRPSLSEHLVLSVVGGGLITVLPAYLCFARPGEGPTRYAATVGQMLWSSMFIHISGGRIETHFYVFVSLAILSNYRDWRLLPLATTVVLLHHALVGTYFPQSVFGLQNSGQWRWLEHALYVLFEDAILIWFCITGKKEMRTIADRQAQLIFTKESIETQVLERTEQLQTAMQLATRANEAKSQFLTNISHEIATPMHGIIGNAQLMNWMPMSDQARAVLDDMQSSTALLGRVLNNILTLSHLEAGRLESLRLKMDYRAVILDLIEPYRHEALKKGLAFEARLSEEPLIAFGDPRRFRQIVGNVLSNALKFTESGSIDIEANWHIVPEQVTKLVVSVRDTGPGIAGDQLESIFDSFTQVDGSSTRTTGGAGAGLALARRLTRMLGGDIVVESQEGVGSVFRAWFPVQLVDAPQLAAPRADLKPAWRRLSGVALVQGSTEMRSGAYAKVLRQMGMDASCGLLQEHAAGAAYDLLVVDVETPQQLDELVRAGRPSPGTLLVIAGNRLIDSAEERLHDVADLVVARPVDLRNLNQLLADLAETPVAEIAA